MTNKRMVAIPEWLLEETFRVLHQQDVDDILKRTREIDQDSFDLLVKVARKVGKYRGGGCD